MKIIYDRERFPNLEAFLLRPLFAHLATALEDGPRDSPVWFLWEDGALWIIGNKKTDTFPKRIQKTRAALSASLTSISRPASSSTSGCGDMPLLKPSLNVQTLCYATIWDTTKALGTHALELHLSTQTVYLSNSSRRL